MLGSTYAELRKCNNSYCKHLDRDVQLGRVSVKDALAIADRALSESIQAEMRLYEALNNDHPTTTVVVSV